MNQLRFWSVIFGGFFSVALIFLLSRYQHIQDFLDTLPDDKNQTHLVFNAGLVYGAGAVSLLMMILVCLINAFRKGRPL